MSPVIKKYSPLWLLLLALFLLFYLGLAIPAGVLFLFAYVITVEKIWPEEWESEKRKKRNELSK